jgi:DNA-binding response OmpR family regulator
MRVLIIEDYAPVRESLARGLSEAGYAVDTAEDGEEGLWHARSGEHDVIVLDLMLPKIDGLSLLQKLRAEANEVHVIILTAKDTVEDRVRGLNLGADDYMVKPFAFEELLARVRRLVMRSYGEKASKITVADLELEPAQRTARRAGEPVDLTAREYAVLEYLAARAGEVFSRAEIWEHIYDFAADRNSNVIDVYVARLRKKLERPGRPALIHTRRGMGYVLGEDEP